MLGQLDEARKVIAHKEGLAASLAETEAALREAEERIRRSEEEKITSLRKKEVIKGVRDELAANKSRNETFGPESKEEAVARASKAYASRISALVAKTQAQAHQLELLQNERQELLNAK